MLSAQQSAGRPDVLSSGNTYRCGDAMIVQVVAEVLHRGHFHFFEWHVRYAMPTDEVDTAVELTK